MKQLPKRNYLILIVLMFLTVLVTLSLVMVYKNRDKLTSSIYNYSNKITTEEFDEYMTENQDFSAANTLRLKPVRALFIPHRDMVLRTMKFAVNTKLMYILH